MLRGIYSAAASMVAEMRRQQTIANNLANLATAGYKQDGVTLATFPSLDVWRTGQQPVHLGPVGTGVLAAGGGLDLSQGSLRETRRALDVAIAGRGFLAVRTEEGTLYTRAGSLQVLSDGTLVDAQGHPLLGEGGPIRVPEGDVAFGPDGTMFAAGQPVGRLLVVDAPQPEGLTKVGDNLLSYAAGAMQAVPEAEVNVVQGYLEDSNVDGSAVMVELMAATRAYEAAQRAARLQDGTLERAIQEVGKA